MAEWLPMAMQAGSMLMGAAGADKAAEGARASAERNAVAKRYEADQLRQAAGQAVAVSQLQAQEERRKARLVQSRTLAVAAASGGGVSDPTMVNILGKIAGEGTYRSNVALYGGEERARVMRMQAEAADYEGAAGIEAGELKADAYETKGMSDLISGGVGLFQKYNAGGLFSGDAAGGVMSSGAFGTGPGV